MLELNKLVFISNSVPKSGSTYLYSLQKNFLESVRGKSDARYAPFTKNDLVNSGYVSKPHSEEFLEIISSGGLKDGPYIFKTHTLINGALREAFLNKNHIFISTATRDPVDIYFSARDNYKKTGEFPEFRDLETGTATINEYFAKILQSSINSGYKKTLPIVKYEDIVTRPLEAMISSFSEKVLLSISLEIARKRTDINESSDMAKNRMNKGVLKRYNPENPSDEVKKILENVGEFTNIMNSLK